MNLLRPQYDNLLAAKPSFTKAKRWDAKEWLSWAVIVGFIAILGFYFGWLVPQQKLDRIDQSIARLKGMAANYHQETLEVLKFANVYIEAYKAGKLEEMPSLAMAYQQRRRLYNQPNYSSLNYEPTILTNQKNEQERKPLKLVDISALLAKESQENLDGFPSFELKMQQLQQQYKAWEEAQEVIHRAENQLMIFRAEQADLEEALKVDRASVMSLIMGGPSGQQQKARFESLELEIALQTEKPVLKPSIVAQLALLDAVKQVEKSKALLVEAQEFFNQLKDQWKLIFPKQADPVTIPVQQNNNPVSNSNTTPIVTTPIKPTVTPEQQRQEAERLRIEAEKRAAEQKRLEEQRQREIEQQKANEALCKSGLSTNCPKPR